MTRSQGSICFHRGMLVFGAIAVGAFLPLDASMIEPILRDDPQTTWNVILIGYCLIASLLPVWLLLQPRDYINAWQLFIAMGLLAYWVLARM